MPNESSLSLFGLALLVTGATSLSTGLRYITTNVSTAPSFVQEKYTAYFATICGSALALAGIACIICACYEADRRIGKIKRQAGLPREEHNDNELKAQFNKMLSKAENTPTQHNPNKSV